MARARKSGAAAAKAAPPPEPAGSIHVEHEGIVVATSRPDVPVASSIADGPGLHTPDEPNEPDS